MVDSAYFVKSSPPRAFIGSFQHFADEPRHDKTIKVTVRPAKTRISLGIRPVWAESLLCTQWVAKGPRFLHADSKDSDQTGRMPRLIWVFAGWTLTLLVLSCCGSDVFFINCLYFRLQGLSSKLYLLPSFILRVDTYRLIEPVKRLLAWVSFYYSLAQSLCNHTSQCKHTGGCCNAFKSAHFGERGGSVVECRTPEREVRGSRPTAAVLCPWARHFTPRKYWLITQEAMAPSRHDWKIVDWDVKPQHNQPTGSFRHWKTGPCPLSFWLPYNDYSTCKIHMRTSFFLCLVPSVESQFCLVVYFKLI